MALSKNNYKLIRSLQTKKGRAKHGLFVVEGKKSVKEFIRSNQFQIRMLFSSDMDGAHNLDKSCEVITKLELKSISSLSNPDDYLGVFEIGLPKKPSEDGLILALDQVNDPGNLGTIIRLCDWFDIKQVWCEKGTVDQFNPKVVQATMGSMNRVEVVYLDLEQTINRTSLNVYLSDMGGESIYDTEFSETGILVMGNEANGVSDKLRTRGRNIISIPQYSSEGSKTESLNVAMATGLILGEIRRQHNLFKT